MEIVALTSWLFSCVVFGVILRHFLRTKALTAFAAVFFLAIPLHVRPLLFLLGLDTPRQEHGFIDFFVLSSVASLVGIVWVVLLAGTFVVARRPMAPLGSVLLPQGPASPPRAAMVACSLLSTALAVAATAYLVDQEGSVAVFMHSVKIGKELTGLYWVRRISNLAAIVCLYGLFASARPAHESVRAHRRPSKRALVFYGAMIVANLAANYLWGNRMNLALFSLAAGLGYHVFVRPFRPRHILVGLVAAAAGLAALGWLRGELTRSATGNEYEAAVDVRALSSSLHFAEFDGLMLALRDAGRRFPFRWGEDFYNGLVGWIPRSIIPGRETFHVGAWFRRVYQPTRVNGWPVTAIGSWYVNFGWLGIIVGAMLSGAIIAAINSAYRSAGDNPWHAAMAPTLGFFVLAGGIDTGFAKGVFSLIVPLALLAVTLRVLLVFPFRNPRSRPVPAHS